MLYLRARYYNPADGRFQSRDTWRGDYNRPLSLNHWNYSENNPVNYVDPTGHTPLRNGYVEGRSISYGLIIGDIIEGAEIVYDYATMTRARFTYTGTFKGIVASAGSAAYVGGIGGFRYGSRGDVRDKSNLFVSDYGGDFIGGYIGAGVKPTTGFTAGVGYFQSPDGSVKGGFQYLSAGLGAPGEIVGFHTYYTVASGVEYYADETGHVDRGKLISHILNGNNSPISFGGAFTGVVFPGLGYTRNSQISAVLLAASLFEDYHQMANILYCPVPPRLYGPSKPIPNPFENIIPLPTLVP